jgi:S1-C subfamily serine protease
MNSSIIQLIVLQESSDLFQPYKSSQTKIIYGTGFIVDIKNGYIITTASNVEGAITITGRSSLLGQRDINLKVMGLCHYKDLALCRIEPNDIELLTRDLNPEMILSLNVKLGDYIPMNLGDEIGVWGYDLNSVRYSSGNISQFNLQIKSNKSERGETEDALTRSPVYFKISASVSEGMGGSPCFNKKNEVIGLVAKTEGYVIPSRTLLAIYSSLLTDLNVKCPTLSLGWSQTNPLLMDEKTGDSGNYGIYVRTLNPDSCLPQLQTGDIIIHIEYPELTLFQPDNFNLSFVTNQIKKPNLNYLMVAMFDRSGDLKLYSLISDKEGGKKYNRLNSRLFGFSEVIDMIPFNLPFWIQINRDKQPYRVEDMYHRHFDSSRIVHISPKLYDYEIFAGLCCVNCDERHLTPFNLTNIFNKQVIIVNIFTGSELYRSKILRIGQVINTINNLPISSLQDVRSILSSSPPRLSIITTDKSHFVIDYASMVVEDKNILSHYNIVGFKYHR